MKKFVIKSLPYLLIGIIFLLIGEFFLFNFKELVPISEITDKQSTSKKEIFYGRRLLPENLSLYKYEMLLKTQPEVLVLGQSVVLQFRDYMFKPFHDKFYNTGLLVRNHKDIEMILDDIESKKVDKPKLIILGVDFSFLTETNFLDNQKLTFSDDLFDSKAHMRALQSVFFGGGKVRYLPKEDWGYGKDGISGRGYRNDGSYRYKPELEQYIFEKTNFDEHLINKLNAKSHPFSAPFKFSNDKAKGLETILKRIKDLDISLVIIFSPMTDGFYNEALKDIEFKQFWSEYSILQNELSLKGFDVIPFSTPATYQINDDYMIDADHPSEVYNSIALLKFLEAYKGNDQNIIQIDKNHLRSLIDSKRTIPKSFLLDSIDYQLVP